MSKSHFSNESRQELVVKLIAKYGTSVTKEQIVSYCIEHSLPNPHFLVSRRDIKNGKMYMLNLYNTTSETVTVNEEEMAPALQAQVLPFKQKRMTTEIDSVVPDKDDTYVPFGFFKQLEMIVKSKTFYPVFITGLSGNGKTTMVEQVAAKLKRDCIRVNVSVETDEEDLIGGNTLQDGNVIYREALF